jgi:hypothetical protein
VFAVQVVGPPHAAQMVPEFPQALPVLPGWQAPVESQHPLKQFAPLQAFGITHTPPLQVWPAPHTTQLAPLFPHADVLVPPWQAPVESLQPLQTQLPFMQLNPVPQALHCAPLAPQLVVVVPLWQVPVESVHPVVQVPPAQELLVQV